ncbi:type IV secretory system conjugative DNA transfer family protein [Cryptosporangium sp. NPDC048952]|uniref:type IV secretory system conjugative DNA transfer family protein n=1 Tax=Cryptosporangium sp. NPDC048952 TaxID=3363961 RepID=UPI003710FC28
MKSRNHTVVGQRFFETAGEQLVAVVLGVVAGVMTGVWLTGQVAGLLFRGSWPNVPLTAGWAATIALPAHWSDPRQAWPPETRDQLPGPIGFAVSAVVVSAGGLILTAVVWRLFSGRQQIRGYASCRQLQRTLSEQAALRWLPRLRPGLPAARTTSLRRLQASIRARRDDGSSPAGMDGACDAGQGLVGAPHPVRALVREVAVPLGRARGSGMPLWANIQNSVLLLAAARQGKTSQVIIPWVARWPGPAVVTSVRRDVALATLTLREAVGPVAVMDLTGTVWPCPLTWTATSDCEDFEQARKRADVMVQVGKPGSGQQDSTNAGFFGMTSTNLLAAWLHAAALANLSGEDILRWALDERDDEPIRLLRDDPLATPGVATMLDLIYRSPVETRSNLWTTAMTAVAPLLSATARTVFCPPMGESLNIEEFLAASGTAYLIVPEREAGALAPMVAAFVDEVSRAAARLAEANPAGRLDPPLGLILDEVANVAPLPTLPGLMSYAAGSGIFVTAVLQNFAQARQRWGRDGADVIWGDATVKIALGGLAGDELQAFATLAGEYRETIWSTQYHHQHGATTQATLVDRKTIQPHEIRTLAEDEREALIIYATTPAVRTRMTRHYESPDAAKYARSTDEVTRRLRLAESLPHGAPVALRQTRAREATRARGETP